MDIKQRIDSLFHQQQQLFRRGVTQSAARRKEGLRRLKQALIHHRAAIYQALADDLGKDKLAVDVSELGVVNAEIDFALTHLEEWMQWEKVPTHPACGDAESFISHEPYGVSYIIGPFNYPINLTLAPLVGAIAGGNTAIIKPSEQTPRCAAAIQAVIEEAFEPGWVSVIQGAAAENSLLLAQPFNLFFFTGSPRVGQIVQAAAAQHLAPVVLELGGKCPLLVLADADLSRVVEAVVAGKLFNSGQTCIAPDYLLVDERVRSALEAQLIQRFEQQFSGLENTGKLVSSQQVERIEEMLANTRGTVLFGGQSDASQRYFQATLVGGKLDWDDALMQSELFAPVLPILGFTRVDQAVEAINTHHPHPLAVYVFTEDRHQGLQIVAAVPSGDAQINGALDHAFSPWLPFGGIGGSGIGEYHGYFSFLAFTHRRSVVIRGCAGE